MPRGLTPKREAFAQAVALGSTQADAYRQAFNAANMLPATIHAKASELAANGKVAARIAALRAPATLKAEELIAVNDERVLFEDARIAFSDARRLFHEDGRMRQPHEWDNDTAGAVASIKVRELFGEGKDGVGAIGTVTEVKFWNKGDALDRLNRRFGAYKADNEQKNDALAAVGRETLKAIEARIAALATQAPHGSGVDRPAIPGSAQPST